MSPNVSIRLLAAQTDSRLVDLVSGGNERAFEALVARYRAPLLRYCSRMGLADSVAEDVVQLSLLKAWMALTEGTSVRELRPWLYRIAHNLAVSTMRGAREQPGQLSETIEHSMHGATPPGAEDRLAAREALGHLAALPEMQRHAIVLTAIEGRSHEEAASVMGITDGAVRGLVHRARASMRTAAASFMPPGLHAWLTRGTEGAQLAERSSELSAGAGVLGVTGALAKGALVAATAGLVIAGGAVVRGGAHQPTAHRHVARVSRGSAGSGSATGAISLLADSSTASPTRRTLLVSDGASTRTASGRSHGRRSGSRGGNDGSSHGGPETTPTRGRSPSSSDGGGSSGLHATSPHHDGSGDGSGATSGSRSPGQSGSGEEGRHSGDSASQPAGESGDGSSSAGVAEAASSGDSGKDRFTSSGGGSDGGSAEQPAETVVPEAPLEGGSKPDGGGS